MKIGVVNNCVPFLSGGAEHLASALTTKLNEYGHQALLVRLPFQWHPAEKILESVLACQMVKIANVDRVIALKFPAYYVPHPNKVLWLLHQFRQVYDLWGTPFQDLPATSSGHKIRESIIAADNALLPLARKIYTNSHVTSERLRRFNGIESEVLFPPLLSSEHFSAESYSDYIFYPSRITNGKRQVLMIEAMRHTKSAVRLVLAGAPEEPLSTAGLRALIARYGLEDRITLHPEFIGERMKTDLMNNALACAYIPVDEDSYGYVTLEAFHARKPVITCTDSGGTHITVRDQATGYIAEPDPQDLADAMDSLYADKARAARMGTAGFELVTRLEITWDTVVKRLTE